MDEVYCDLLQYQVALEEKNTAPEQTQQFLQSVLDSRIPLTALRLAIGRHAACAIHTGVLDQNLGKQRDSLMENIGRGDTDTFNAPVFPRGEVRGFGYYEASPGVLPHWAVLNDGKISDCQCGVRSIWNAGPRDANDEMGPCEASLIDIPMAGLERPEAACFSEWNRKKRGFDKVVLLACLFICWAIMR